MKSKKLKEIDTHYRDLELMWRLKGFGGIGDRPNIRTHESNDDFPLPWYAKCADPLGIYAVYAANGAEVSGWLSDTDANQIVKQVNK